MVERGHHQFAVRDAAAGEGVVAVESEYSPIEFIGPRFCYRVDAGAGEAGLCDVVGGDIDLDLVDGVEGDGLGVGLAAGGGGVQAEGVVEDGAVEREVIVLAVAPGERQSIISRGGGGGEAQVVVGRAGDGREVPDETAADIGRGARFFVVEAPGVGGNRDAGELLCFFGEGDLDGVVLPQFEKDIIRAGGFEVDIRGYDAVGAADAQVGNGKMPVLPRRYGQLYPRFGEADGNAGPAEGFAFGVPDEAAECGRRDLAVQLIEREEE